MVRRISALVTVLLLLAPLTANAADLVVWWDKAFYPTEDEALRQLVQDFEAKTGLVVELVRHNEWETAERLEAAIANGQPPDFLWSLLTSPGQRARYAAEDRLVDLGETIGGLSDIFDQEFLELCMLANSRTDRRGLYCLPTGRATNHVHVWLSLLEQAGFKREDIPAAWEPFWSFWCEKVQPAVRKALGRQDIGAVGAPVSVGATDTHTNLRQFIYAYTDAWPTPSGPSLLRDPAARTALIKGLAGYTAIYKQGCTPPDSPEWTSVGNNQAFLEQRVVMTPNYTLSIPRPLEETRPNDYDENAITIDWPSDAFGRAEHMAGGAFQALVFKDGGHTAAAKALVRFMVEGGGLAQYLTDAGDRVLPPSQKLLDQPFWLDRSDPHRMRSVVQSMTRPHVWSCYGLDREEVARLERAGRACFLSIAVNRVAVDGLTPEQAADELIAKIREILKE